MNSDQQQKDLMGSLGKSQVIKKFTNKIGKKPWCDLTEDDDDMPHYGDDEDDMETVINCGEDLFMELCEAWLDQHGSKVLETVLNKPKRNNNNKK